MICQRAHFLKLSSFQRLFWPFPQGPYLSYPAISTMTTVKDYKLWATWHPPVGKYLTHKVTVFHTNLSSSLSSATAACMRHQICAGSHWPTVWQEKARSVWHQILICMTNGKLLSLSGHHFPPLLKGLFPSSGFVRIWDNVFHMPGI